VAVGTVPATPPGMTMPRQVLPGTTYLVTRRCAQRQFLLRPSDETNAIVLYLLAVAAQRFGVLVHAFCVLSNHLHLVVTDPDACLPAFAQFLDALVARALNRLHGRSESFWAPGSFSAVALLSPEDVVDKVAYALANPVAAGLVPRGRDWPGLWSGPERAGASIGPVARPRFFRSVGRLPDEVALDLALPPGFASMEEFQRRVRAAVAVHEGQAVLAIRAAGRTFLGARAALRQRPTATPSSAEARGGLRPTFASRDRWRRSEATHQVREFMARYRRAWAVFSAGQRDVVFPAGTYWMRVVLGVRCGPGGNTSCAPAPA
jgi:REP element-mobilizing transposase RayT